MHARQRVHPAICEKKSDIVLNKMGLFECFHSSDRVCPGRYMFWLAWYLCLLKIDLTVLSAIEEWVLNTREKKISNIIGRLNVCANFWVLRYLTQDP